MKFWNVLLLCLCPYIAFAEPPREIPGELVNAFTMHGTVPVIHLYFNDSYPPSQPAFYSRAAIDAYMEMVIRKSVNYYGETDAWLYQMLERYPIYGKEVAIIGSVLPWYESIILAYGGRPTTIEYNKITTDDSRIAVLTVDEYNQNPKKFDILLSISSIEHDGLGRYGDPLNPNGDLEFMAMAKQKFLKEDGRMILAVPMGKDCLAWNAHRIYGPRRFPLLIQEWNVIDSIGFSEAGFHRVLGEYWYQPVFYLAPKH